MAEVARKRRDGGGGVAMFSLWEFANALDTPMNQELQNIAEPTEAIVKKLNSRICLLETAESIDFAKKTHLVSTIVGATKKKWRLQVWNQSGDKDGKAKLENCADI